MSHSRVVKYLHFGLIGRVGHQPKAAVIEGLGNLTVCIWCPGSETQHLRQKTFTHFKNSHQYGHLQSFYPPEHSALVHGKISPPNDFPHEHTAPFAMRMPHLPITATTKMAEIKGPDSPSSPACSPPSPVSEASPTSQSAASTKQTQPIEEPIQPGGWWCQPYLNLSSLFFLNLKCLFVTFIVCGERHNFPKTF